MLRDPGAGSSIWFQADKYDSPTLGFASGRGGGHSGFRPRVSSRSILVRGSLPWKTSLASRKLWLEPHLVLHLDVRIPASASLSWKADLSPLCFLLRIQSTEVVASSQPRETCLRMGRQRQKEVLGSHAAEEGRTFPGVQDSPFLGPRWGSLNPFHLSSSKKVVFCPCGPFD